MLEVTQLGGSIIAAVKSAAGDERSSALATRVLLRDALNRPSFRMNLVDQVLESIAVQGAGWSSPPLYVSPNGELRIRLTYWPPGYRNETHTHIRWTVTGVVHNEIAVELMDSDGPDARVLRTIVAKDGDTGHLLPPCAHRVHNTSAGYSVLLHVFSEGGANAEAREAIPDRPIRMASRSRALRAIVPLVCTWSGSEVTQRLLRIFELGDNEVKLLAVKGLIERDFAVGMQKSLELEACLTGTNQHALSSINAALLSRPAAGASR